MKIVTLSFFLLLRCISGNPEVHTSLGKIRGLVYRFHGAPVTMFLGIPFVKPPLGSLRFQKPEPMEPWGDFLQATNQPPACMQYRELNLPWFDDMPGKSEDCLYLNIYAPLWATKGSKLAVLFWIFGGGFTYGSNRMDLHNGLPLAEEGIIVVTINYRLGLFGFFTTNTNDAPGNVALYDMVMALQWVNDNIEYFGGDKNRITISGNSAGAISVGILCVSPLAKGLFSRAITESGSITWLKYNMLDYNLKLSERLAEAVGCANENFTLYNHPNIVVECLRSKNATYLTKTLWSFHPFATRSFFPQYGDDLLPNNALDDMRNGNFHNVPLLAGDVRDEGSFQIATSHPDEFGFYGEKDPKVNKTYAETLLGGIFKNYTDPQKYTDFYLRDVADDNYDLIRRQVYTASGDSSLLCPTVYFAERYADRKNDVYYYFFTHSPSTTIWAEWMGVAHFEEVQFVFGRPIRKPGDYRENEVWLSKQVMKMWANFAKYGHPGANLNWPKFSKENHTYLNIDIDRFGSLDAGPHLKNCNFLRSHFGF